VDSDTDCTAAPPDDEITVEGEAIIDESSPPCAEITAPPIIIITNDEIIPENDLDAAGVRNTPVAPKLVLLAPTCVNDVSSQNIEKLTSVIKR